MRHKMMLGELCQQEVDDKNLKDISSQISDDHGK